MAGPLPLGQLGSKSFLSAQYNLVGRRPERTPRPDLKRPGPGRHSSRHPLSLGLPQAGGKVSKGSFASPQELWGLIKEHTSGYRQR